jgi:glycosyltransferase involved in cell wall biosynthesis
VVTWDNEATLVVIPSRLEGFGLVALEAALMARPVVGARVGGLREVVLHEQTGLLVEMNDSAGFNRVNYAPTRAPRTGDENGPDGT